VNCSFTTRCAGWFVFIRGSFFKGMWSIYTNACRSCSWKL